MGGKLTFPDRILRRKQGRVLVSYPSHARRWGLRTAERGYRL